jgi:hypothetical protein
MRKNGRARKTVNRRSNSGRNGRSREKKSCSSGTTRTISEPRKWTARRTRNRSVNRRSNSGRNGRSREKKSCSSATTRTTSGLRKWTAKRARNRSVNWRSYPGGKVKNRRKTGNAKANGFLRRSTSGAPEYGENLARRMFHTG